MIRKKLGEILLERNIIDQDQLNAALAYQRQWGHRLGVALVAKGFITEGMLVKILGEVMGLQTVDLSKITFDHDALRLVSGTICESNDLIPIGLEEVRGSRTLTVAMADPLNLSIVDEIEFTTGCKVRTVLSTISTINSAVRKYYRGQNTLIRPLLLSRVRAPETGKMQLVRPGGEVEEVDTSVQDVAKVKKAGKAEAAAPSPLGVVAEIKAERAKRLSSENKSKISSEEVMKEYIKEVQTSDWETLHKLEKYFWALMRVMAKKGMISKEEFLREMKDQ